jgi:hypothetical protein
VEYPGGEYSDDALFRLGLLAEARGQASEARAHLLVLTRDYPASPFRARAQLLLGELGTASDDPAEGREVLRRPGLTMAVQVGAFQELAGARALADEVTGMGYEPRLVRVPGSDLIKVRIGRFSRREAADALAGELRARGVECTLSSDAHRELAVR